MRNFREYSSWKDGIKLSVNICEVSRTFPIEERYALGDQIRRAAVSIPSNIAEGSGRESETDFAHFLDIALGSAYEVETQLIIARNLDYISEDTFKSIMTDLCLIQRRISTFIHTIRHMH